MVLFWPVYPMQTRTHMTSVTRPSSVIGRLYEMTIETESIKGNARIIHAMPAYREVSTYTQISDRKFFYVSQSEASY